MDRPKSSLCWYCKKVMVNECPFHSSFIYEPYVKEMQYKEIPGWKINVNEQGVRVLSCPLFEKYIYTHDELIKMLKISPRAFYRNKDRYLTMLHQKGMRCEK